MRKYFSSVYMSLRKSSNCPWQISYLRRKTQAKVDWVWSLIFSAFSVGGVGGICSLKFTEKAVSPYCCPPAMWRLQGGCEDGGFLVWQTWHQHQLRKQKTLGGLSWLAVSRQGHDSKTCCMAPSHCINPLTLSACAYFRHFSQSITSHLTHQ